MTQNTHPAESPLEPGSGGSAAEQPGATIKDAQASEGAGQVSSPEGSGPLGIDVSIYQGNINWQTVASQGIAFAYARATNGTSIVDSCFAENWSGMQQAGLLRGAYHYFHPEMDPTQQAQLFVQQVQSLAQGDMQPMLDVEDDGGTDADTIVSNMQTWINYVTQALGRGVTIYTNPNFWENSAGNSTLFASTCPLWVADWGVDQPALFGGWTVWSFWQYSESGQLNGISGAVDLDCFNGTMDNLRKFAGY